MKKRKYYGGTDGAHIYYHNILKPFFKTGNAVAGEWDMVFDDWMGTFGFTNRNSDAEIYATPYWEGVDGVDVSVIINNDHHSSRVVELPMITGDSKKDSEAYFTAMLPVLAEFSAHN